MNSTTLEDSPLGSLFRSPGRSVGAAMPARSMLASAVSDAIGPTNTNELFSAAGVNPHDNRLTSESELRNLSESARERGIPLEANLTLGPLAKAEGIDLHTATTHGLSGAAAQSFDSAMTQAAEQVLASGLAQHLGRTRADITRNGLTGEEAARAKAWLNDVDPARNSGQTSSERTSQAEGNSQASSATSRMAGPEVQRMIRTRASEYMGSRSNGTTGSQSSGDQQGSRARQQEGADAGSERTTSDARGGTAAGSKGTPSQRPGSSSTTGIASTNQPSGSRGQPSGHSSTSGASGSASGSTSNQPGPPGFGGARSASAVQSAVGGLQSLIASALGQNIGGASAASESAGFGPGGGGTDVFELRRIR
jgi:hypothetical protein